MPSTQFLFCKISSAFKNSFISQISHNKFCQAEVYIAIRIHVEGNIFAEWKDIWGFPLEPLIHKVWKLSILFWSLFPELSKQPYFLHQVKVYGLSSKNWFVSNEADYFLLD